MNNHFATSIYIFNKDKTKILLGEHKKSKNWWQFGGHLEENEIPSQSVLRELFEETGILPEQVSFLTPKNFGMIQVCCMQLNTVGDHQHIDLVYLATVDENLIKINPQEGESKNIKWFNKYQLKNEFSTKKEAEKYWTTTDCLEVIFQNIS
jgi:8-oxo-dGTP diphosphatase